MPDSGFAMETLAALIPFESLQPQFMRRALLGLLLLAPITSVMGAQVVNLRMAFFADAISHSVFAGVAVGILAGIDPQWSTVALALAIGLGVTACQRRVALSADSVIGVFFSGVVAFGLAAASRDRLIARHAQSFLYGDVLTLGDGELALLALALALVAVFQIAGYNKMLYIGVNPALASAHGIGVGACQYVFSVLLALTAVLAVWTVGVFLVTALLVLPAAAARNVTRSAVGMFWWALAVSLISAVGGLLVSAQTWAGTATGPTVVLVAFACFLATVPFGRKRARQA